MDLGRLCWQSLDIKEGRGKDRITLCSSLDMLFANISRSDRPSLGRALPSSDLRFGASPDKSSATGRPTVQAASPWKDLGQLDPLARALGANWQLALLQWNMVCVWTVFPGTTQFKHQAL